MNCEVNAIRFFTFISLLCFANTVSADSLWNHNGSIMHLVENGTKREIYYAEPRQGMMEAGVKPGTLFFDGERIGDDYFGTARVFSSKCQAPMTFSISGRMIDEQTLVLEGNRPKFSNCKATGEMKYESLEFNFMQVIKGVEEESVETELQSVESVEKVPQVSAPVADQISNIKWGSFDNQPCFENSESYEIFSSEEYTMALAGSIWKFRSPDLSHFALSQDGREFQLVYVTFSEMTHHAWTYHNLFGVLNEQNDLELTEEILTIEPETMSDSVPKYSRKIQTSTRKKCSSTVNSTVPSINEESKYSIFQAEGFSTLPAGSCSETLQHVMENSPVDLVSVLSKSQMGWEETFLPTKTCLSNQSYVDVGLCNQLGPDAIEMKITEDFIQATSTIRGGQYDGCVISYEVNKAEGFSIGKITQGDKCYKPSVNDSAPFFVCANALE
jgi:hypothetical protein